jgi:hypothetical protein
MVTKIIFFALDTAPKPYYFGSKNPHVSAVFTTALLDLASVRSTRATAANHRQLISACRRDELGVANSDIGSDGSSLSAAFRLSRCAPACRGAGRGAPREGAREKQGALSASP